ncbi:hypothetical protein FBU59_006210, partial [Linderina macrospora]
MYTFADFALPGQPLPPELQGLANMNASAMIPPSGGPGQPGQPGPQGNPLYTGYTPGQQGYPQDDMSGASTPAYTQSEYEVSPALPPLSYAVGRGGHGHPGSHHMGRGPFDPMTLPTPPLGVDQAVLDLFEYVTPGFPIVHRQTLVQNIRDRSLTLPLWLAIHAVSARFESQHGNKQLQQQQPHLPPHLQRGGPAAVGAIYAEKAHAMLVNRFGHRQPRPQWARNERGRMVIARDGSSQDASVSEKDMCQREVIELLQSYILLSIYYAGNWELELAVETHATAVRIAQRMGLHLIDDPTKLQDISGIFNTHVAKHQRKRARDIVSPSVGPAQWKSIHSRSGPAPLAGSPANPGIREGADCVPLPPGESNAVAVNITSPADLRKQWIENETLRRLW